MRLVLPALALLLALGAGLVDPVTAELESHHAYVLKGSGFAATELIIKTSQIDLTFIVDRISNGRGAVSVEDGLVTLDNKTYKIGEMSGTVLRDGKFLRISGTIQGSSDTALDLRIIGRLVEDGRGGSVYSFSGRVMDNTEYKTIYAAKISEFVGGTTKQATKIADDTVHILNGASLQGLNSTYSARSTVGGGYFQPDRIMVNPGGAITLVNDDSVSHRLVSGAAGSDTRVTAKDFVMCAESDIGELPKGFSFAKTNCSFTLDGKIDTKTIEPGGSVKVTFKESGFYRLIDSDYPWMTITAYSFKNLDNSILDPR